MYGNGSAHPYNADAAYAAMTIALLLAVSRLMLELLIVLLTVVLTLLCCNADVGDADCAAKSCANAARGNGKAYAADVAADFAAYSGASTACRIVNGAAVAVLTMWMQGLQCPSACRF